MKIEEVVTAVLEGSASPLGSHAFLEEWWRILDGADVDRVVEIITDASDEGQRLRSSSPFVAPLSPEKRLAACEQRAAV